MRDVITVPEARRGPPGSGNGGWVAGEMAALLRPVVGDRTPVEVTLRAPVPLDTEMQVRVSDGSLSIHHGDVLVAVAVPADLNLEVPEPPAFDEAVAAAGASMSRQPATHPMLPGVRTGPHPICFCCGAELGPDEGCHVEVSPFAERGMVAGAWRCPPVFAVDGLLPEPIIFTALDCPGQFAWLAERPEGYGLLGRITGQVLAPVAADDDLIVTGWTLGSDGRKLFAGTALHRRDGELVARARSTWFTRVG